MAVFFDQLHRAVNIPQPPRRIVSLVPSQTELLYDLGLAEQMAGCTKFCVHPKGFKNKLTAVGGTKQVDMKVIHELQPDLIIANKEENQREDIEALMQQYPVWISDIKNYAQALEMIAGVSAVTNRSEQGNELIKRIAHEFTALSPVDSLLNTVYLIWRKPYMAAGTDTFIHDMMQQCGFRNAITETRYPAVAPERLQQLNPQVVVLSSEPYPFRKKHIAELQALLPGAQVLLADGEMFSWYGSRLQYAPAYFAQLRQQATGFK